MANLNPTPGWDNIPQLEVVTPALAGAAGPMNTQAQALLNRSEQLKIDLDTLTNNLDQVNNTADIDKPVSTATQAALDLKAPLANPTFTGTVSGISKVMVGLGNVDNTSDLSKPVSTAAQAALNLRAPLESPTFTGTVNGITKAMVGLGNVDNTPDASKPVSTPQQNVLNLKANKSGDTFTGPVTATQFNGSGAGLTGTASSLTAGGANAVNGISGWSYSNQNNNPVYLWCTEGSAASQHLTTPGSLSVNYANSAGSLSGAITAAGGVFSGNIGAAGNTTSTYGYLWNAATTASALVSQNWFSNGEYQTVSIGSFSSHGDVSIFAAYHKPGIESFVQWNIGGSGNYFRMSNNGVGFSQGGWTNTSDIRVKENRVVISSALDKVDALTGYTFDRTDMTSYEGVTPRKAGVIAQDVLKVLPEAVIVPSNYDAEAVTGDQLTLHSDALIGLLVNAIKELRAEVTALKAAALPVQ